MALDFGSKAIMVIMVIRNIPSIFKGPSPKHCQVISVFCTRGHCDLDLCPRCHLLVRTNILSKFEGPSTKHCKVIKLFSTKDHGHLDHDCCPWCHLLVRPLLSLRALAPSIAKLSSFLVLNVLVTLTFARRIIYW